LKLKSAESKHARTIFDVGDHTVEPRQQHRTKQTMLGTRVRKPSSRSVAAKASAEQECGSTGEEAEKSSKRKRVQQEKKTAKLEVGTSILSDEDYFACGFPDERVPEGFRHNPAFNFVGMAESAFAKHLARFLEDK
jgi:hypothetical protein